jgi:hypothetical protein
VNPTYEELEAQLQSALALAEQRAGESKALRTALEIIAGCPTLRCVKSLCAAALSLPENP